MSETFLTELFSLDDQVAVVIGGTGVLGGAIAEGLAGAGAAVVVAGRSEERGEKRVEMIQRQGGQATFVPVDATRRESIEALLEAALAGRGRVDMLVNCAGTNQKSDYLDVTDDQWDAVIGSQLRATHLGCQVFSRQMIDAGGGAILNVGSVSSEVPLSGVFAYSAAKAGVVNLTKNLARELAPHDVRVNALCPGFFPAEQNRQILTPERTEAIMSHTPMRRFGQPHELVGPALLLLSRSGGSFITGATLYVDGGFTAMAI